MHPDAILLLGHTYILEKPVDNAGCRYHTDRQGPIFRARKVRRPICVARVRDCVLSCLIVELKLLALCCITWMLAEASNQ